MEGAEEWAMNDLCKRCAKQTSTETLIDKDGLFIYFYREFPDQINLLVSGKCMRFEEAEEENNGENE